mmetsp:Transcript_119346/g.207174  ORF Transcript_119346/g.207174 Transcript_119346/m.207174 type:complete len:382 (-) Transcript_119346:135-1280(-)
MALPQDFWQNEHMFHRFHSKPCQRLLRSGFCEWNSQCQFSHDLEWPRRPPSKHSYSPVLCPHMRPVVLNNSGEVHMENHCPAGLSCTFAHTKDEVLYHPQIFKTILCEEHRSLPNDQRSARRSKHRSRCHRYYCPFAHGKQELRSSPLTAEQCEACVRAVVVFPHGMCCNFCSHNSLAPVCADGSSALNYAASLPSQDLTSNAEASHQLWAGAAPNLLSQMVLSGCPPEPFAEVTKGALWGGSPWLQQPAQDRQDVGGLMAKSIQDVEAAARDTVESQLDEAEPDAQEDVGSEIYERVVRFVNEISSEESDSDSRTTAATERPEVKIPQSSSCWLQAAKESNPASYNSLFQPTWGQETKWIGDTRNQERWQKGSKTSFWML